MYITVGEREKLKLKLGYNKYNFIHSLTGVNADPELLGCLPNEFVGAPGRWLLNFHNDSTVHILLKRFLLFSTFSHQYAVSQIAPLRRADVGYGWQVAGGIPPLAHRGADVGYGWQIAGGIPPLAHRRATSGKTSRMEGA